MKKILFSFFLIGLIGSFQTARAEVLVWNDPQFGISVTFPDTWAQGLAHRDYERLKVIAPSGNDKVKCSLSAKKDQRYLIYPQSFMQEIINKERGKDFWLGHLSDYENIDIHRIMEDKGLGDGDATYATADYIKHDGVSPVQTRAFMFAGLYYDIAVIYHCEAPVQMYAQWQPEFAKIMSTIDYKKMYNEHITGHYRDDFLHEPPYLMIGVPKDHSTSLY